MHCRANGQMRGVRFKYRTLSNIGATENNYRVCRRLQLEPKNLRTDQRAPKLGRCLRAAIKTVLEVFQSPSILLTIPFSGSDYASGKNNKKYDSTFSPFWKIHSDH